MRNQEWNAALAQLDTLDLAELVACLLFGDTVDGETALGVVDKAEVLASLLDGDHVHETGWVDCEKIGVSMRFPPSSSRTNFLRAYRFLMNTIKGMQHRSACRAASAMALKGASGAFRDLSFWRCCRCRSATAVYEEAREVLAAKLKPNSLASQSARPWRQESSDCKEVLRHTTFRHRPGPSRPSCAARALVQGYFASTVLVCSDEAVRVLKPSEVLEISYPSLLILTTSGAGNLSNRPYQEVAALAYSFIAPARGQAARRLPRQDPESKLAIVAAYCHIVVYFLFIMLVKLAQCLEIGGIQHCSHDGICKHRRQDLVREKRPTMALNGTSEQRWGGHPPCPGLSSLHTRVNSPSISLSRSQKVFQIER
ncbi:hypothetical protein KC333_g207 [Hortaea werneckii]|nr:hypothetical protein KC333_g207 [Hortaea werneckii]